MKEKLSTIFPVGYIMLPGLKIMGFTLLQAVGFLFVKSRNKLARALGGKTQICSAHPGQIHHGAVMSLG